MKIKNMIKSLKRENVLFSDTNIQNLNDFLFLSIITLTVLLVALCIYYNFSLRNFRESMTSEQDELGNILKNIDMGIKIYNEKLNRKHYGDEYKRITSQNSKLNDLIFLNKCLTSSKSYAEGKLETYQFMNNINNESVSYYLRKVNFL